MKIKILIWGLFVLLSTLSIFAFRKTIMRQIGNYLISENKLKKADVIFVLGGSSFDRGNEAARLYKKGFANKIICMGKNIPSVFKAINKNYSEAEITRINIVNNNIKPQYVELLEEGTSTKEESEAILNYCVTHSINRIILISDKFHTKRIRSIFDPLFRDKQTELIIYGVASSFYDENAWWKEEQGLLMVNNEYVKLVYYWVKY